MKYSPSLAAKAINKLVEAHIRLAFFRVGLTGDDTTLTEAKLQSAVLNANEELDEALADINRRLGHE